MDVLESKKQLLNFNPGLLRGGLTRKVALNAAGTGYISLEPQMSDVISGMGHWRGKSKDKATLGYDEGDWAAAE